MSNEHRRLQIREALTAYGLLAPALLGVVAFLVTPILVLVALSFANWNVLSPIEFVGIGNWQWALTSGTVWRSLGVTTLFVALVVPLTIAAGLWLAVLLNRALPGSALVRTILVLPWVSAPVVIGIVWRWLLQYGGVVDTTLDRHLGILTDARFALPAVAFVQAWSQVGYVCLFFLAGLASIPKDFIEAARIDGAREWGIFWRVKFPLLRPTLFFVTVTGIIAAAQSFDLVYALSPNGGPSGTTDLIAARIYQQAIPLGNIGQAAVLALILFAVLIAVTLVQNAYFARKTTYER